MTTETLLYLFSCAGLAHADRPAALAVLGNRITNTGPSQPGHDAQLLAP